jgi:hypothetical protein
VTPAQYIAAAPHPKRKVLEELDALIRRTVPSFEPYVAGTMLGYGRYHYRYASGREGDSCRVGLASTKTGFSLYVCLADESGYIVEQEKARLGKVDVGKSCIRFKRLEDLNLRVVEELLAKARRMKAPGETTDAAPAKTAAKKPAAKKPAAEKLAAKKPAVKKKAAAKKPTTKRARA